MELMEVETIIKKEIRRISKKIKVSIRMARMPMVTVLVSGVTSIATAKATRETVVIVRVIVLKNNLLSDPA